MSCRIVGGCGRSWLVTFLTGRRPKTKASRLLRSFDKDDYLQIIHYSILEDTYLLIAFSQESIANDFDLLILVAILLSPSRLPLFYREYFFLVVIVRWKEGDSKDYTPKYSMLKLNANYRYVEPIFKLLRTAL